MFENLNQEQFEQLINCLILYKQFNKNKEVYLNEKSIKEALSFVQKKGSELFDS
jgi:hypothetical protein